MKKPYFYILQHIKSGLFYAGVRYAKGCDSNDLMTELGYKTSSKRIAHLIEEDGLDSFIIRKLRHFDSAEDAIKHEIKFLNKVDARSNEKFLNASNNDGGFTLGTDAFKKLMMDRYGVEHPLQLEHVKEKAKITCIKKYGTTFATQSDLVKEKTKRTCERKYGTTWFNSDEFKTKRKATMMNRYGVTNSTPKHKESMKSKTSGENHRMFSGYYVTPTGKYASAYLAIVANPGTTRKNIYKFCLEPDTKISKIQFSHVSYLRENFDLSIIGKTPREIGFWFEPK